jgi:hypothetical protein
MAIWNIPLCNLKVFILKYIQFNLLLKHLNWFFDQFTSIVLKQF